MRIFKWDSTYYCIINSNYNIDLVKKEYMFRANVKNDSFSEKYIEKIFNNLFDNLTDLKKEYKDFYGEEYSDFNTFLYQKELFEEEIEDLNIQEYQTLLKINMDLNSYNASTLFEYEDDFINDFNMMLEDVGI